MLTVPAGRRNPVSSSSSDKCYSVRHSSFHLVNLISVNYIRLDELLIKGQRSALPSPVTLSAEELMRVCLPPAEQLPEVVVSYTLLFEH